MPLPPRPTSLDLEPLVRLLPPITLLPQELADRESAADLESADLATPRALDYRPTNLQATQASTDQEAAVEAEAETLLHPVDTETVDSVQAEPTRLSHHLPLTELAE